MSRATLLGCGQQYVERRFKFLERVWCVMTKLYRRQSLCGPLTNSFAETNRTRAAFGQIWLRVSRWPTLSERQSGPCSQPGTGVPRTRSVRIAAANGKPCVLRVWVFFVVACEARLVFVFEACCTAR